MTTPVDPCPPPLCLFALLLALGTTLTAEACQLQLTLLGQYRITTGTTSADGVDIGGLSGIDYIAASGRYVAISDARASVGDARFHLVDVDFDGGTLNCVTVSNPVAIAGAGPLTRGAVDAEAIRYDDRSHSLYWASEGDARAGITPAVRETRLDGSFVRDLEVPAHYHPTADRSAGIRNNLAFESLTLGADGKSLWVATENALYQDGPRASLTAGSPSRVLEIDLRSGLAGAEYIYVTEPIAQAPILAATVATNGLVEILAIDATHFLAVERSYSVGAGNSIRLYLADLDGATDVSGLPDGITGRGVSPIRKTLIADLGKVTGLRMDNLEGIAFGPRLNGMPTLLLVSDNNFNPMQVTQFVALGVTQAPQPAGERAACDRFDRLTRAPERADRRRVRPTR